jgi:uncharacterized cupredoxin-like copper-binding protein
MSGTNHHRRDAMLLLASFAILLAACGPAAAPTWTYTPLAAPTAGPASTASAAPSAPSATTQPTDAATAAPSAAALDGGTVTLSEWKVAMPATIKAGKATFTIANAGTTPHEMLIFKSDLAPSAYPTDASGIIEDGAGVSVLSDGENIDPGKTQTRTVDLTPGTYLFVCNIPGHFALGMYTVVTVTQ